MVSLALITEAFPALTPAQWCQAFFGISSASILAMQVIPKAAQHLLLDYGARSPVTTIITDDRSKEAAGPEGSNVFNDLVKAVASVGQIPHSWFMHFYIASVAGSALWAWQYLQGGSAITFIAAQQAASGTPSMSLEQTMLVWILMALQGARRLHECLFVMKPGSSKMWFVHWLLGLGFYLCMSVSVWVDGSGESLFIDPPSLLETTKSNHGSLLSLPTIVGTAVYVYGWSNQHLCHKYLASLKKYSLPDQGLFRYIVCPHYTCECLIYLGLAVAAAPEGRFINRTLLCAFWFIVTNLGTTADGTKQWYAQRFGNRKLRNLHYIAICEACSGCAHVLAGSEIRFRSQEVPVHNCLGGELDVLLDIGNAMQVIGVEALGRDEEASGLLKNACYGLQI
ncbi:3-oxo-5-alpha-steroid 4-dehydrogenase [Colletotrichum higginsianum]|nr:3-oxo-5-alpha-steroid 4-dehydrogenase [Colletotrichum higginsianum]